METEDDETPLLLKVDKPLNRLLTSIACDKGPTSPLGMLATDLGTYNAEFAQFLSNAAYSNEACASDWWVWSSSLTHRLHLKVCNAQAARLTLTESILRLSGQITRDLQVLCVEILKTFCAVLCKKPMAQLFLCYPRFRSVIQTVFNFVASCNSNAKIAASREELLEKNDMILAFCYAVASEFFRDLRKCKLLENALLARSPEAFDALMKNKDRIDPSALQKYEVFLSYTSIEDIEDILASRDGCELESVMTCRALSGSPFEKADYLCILEVIFHKSTLNFYSNYREKYKPCMSTLGLFVDWRSHRTDESLDGFVERQQVLLREEISKHQERVSRWNRVGDAAPVHCRIASWESTASA